MSAKGRRPTGDAKRPKWFGDEERYSMVPTAALEHMERLGYGARHIAVFVSLVRHADNETGVSWPSQVTIGRESGLARQTAHETVIDLERAGVVKVDRSDENHPVFRLQRPPYAKLDDYKRPGGSNWWEQPDDERWRWKEPADVRRRREAHEAREREGVVSDDTLSSQATPACSAMVSPETTQTKPTSKPINQTQEPDSAAVGAFFDDAPNDQKGNDGAANENGSAGASDKAARGVAPATGAAKSAAAAAAPAAGAKKESAAPSTDSARAAAEPTSAAPADPAFDHAYAAYVRRGGYRATPDEDDLAAWAALNPDADQATAIAKVFDDLDFPLSNRSFNGWIKDRCFTRFADDSVYGVLRPLASMPDVPEGWWTAERERKFSSLWDAAPWSPSYRLHARDLFQQLDPPDKAIADFLRQVEKARAANPNAEPGRVRLARYISEALWNREHSARPNWFAVEVTFE